MTRPIYMLGDIHGDYAGLLEILDERKIRDAVVIHVGDGHEGFPECGLPVLETLNQEFATRGVEYLSIRGNHCNPTFFEGDHLLSNLKLLPDYTRLELNGETWLFAGGAVSVNRIDKIQSGEWWSREGFRLDPSKAGPADVLVTHSGPNWIGPGFNSPIIKTYAQAEDELGTSSLVADLKEERRQHERLFRMVSISFTVSQTYALGRAAGNGHFETVAYLLTEVADNDEAVGLALVDAAASGQTQIVELLFCKKSEVDENNDAALLAAAGAGHAETVMYLLDRVGDIDAPDVFGVSGAALRESAANGRTATVACLIGHGADIHAPDENGPEAALHGAVNNRHPETVAELLSNYSTTELAAILATTVEPLLMEVIRSEYGRRLENAVSEAIRSQPDIVI